MNYRLQNSQYKSNSVAWISSAVLLCSGLMAAQAQQTPSILTPAQQEAKLELDAARNRQPEPPRCATPEQRGAPVPRARVEGLLKDG